MWLIKAVHATQWWSVCQLVQGPEFNPHHSKREKEREGKSDFISINLDFGRLKQEYLEFQASLGYTARPSFLKKKK
jgi:hypothetical protein